LRVTDGCPVSEADGHDQPWAIDELVPGVAARVDDFVIGFEDAVGEPVLGMYCQTFSARLSSGDLRGSSMMVKMSGTMNASAMCQPA
jgi:hypothetical protein